MSPKFLLIGHPDETLWFHNLENALKTLGELQVLPQKEAMQYIRQNKCDMAIIDKSFVEQELPLISEIRSQQPDARIIVVTSTPTWTQVRDILKAGAMNYISKSMSEREYFSVFEDTLAKQPPAQRQ